eukprot:gene10488-14095_t
MDWEPLPKRKKSRTCKQNSSQTIDNEEEVLINTNKFDDINENISNRTHSNRALTTLESRDGCAGEFYEYLDHTADVQCHTWGSTLKEAFENMAPCMLNYMTDISNITSDPEESLELTVCGHDMQSLLYNYMNELLFKFSTDSFCTVKVDIKEFDRENFKINATLHGDIFDLTKHSSGTEIKAITYSNMQIHEIENRSDLFVIVDI